MTDDRRRPPPFMQSAQAEDNADSFWNRLRNNRPRDMMANVNRGVSTFRIHRAELDFPICVRHSDGNVIGVNYNERPCRWHIIHSHVHNETMVEVECDEFKCLLINDSLDASFRVYRMEVAVEQPTFMGRVEPLSEVLTCTDGELALLDSGSSGIRIDITSEDEIVERVMKEVEKRMSKRKHISLG